MKLGIAKFGHIGSSLLDNLLDERADRDNLEIISIGSGSDMDKESVLEVVEELIEQDVDVYIVVSPNPSNSSVLKGLMELKKTNKPLVVVGDLFGKKASDELEKNDIGYVFVYGDALIGARREFLDPVEMGDFNSNILKVLSCTGVFRKLIKEIDRFINFIKKDKSYLPQTVLDASEIVSDEFCNPYAKAKARASLEIAQEVAEKNQEACFVLENKEEYLPLVTATHEMMKKAADLAEEAREIEKSNNSVLRTPHNPDGSVSSKRKL